MNKHLTAAAFAAALITSPALAQEMETYTPEQVTEAQTAIGAAELSDEAYLNLWCGAAFVIINQLMQARGMTDEGAQMVAMGDVVYQKAATELIGLGVNEADFTALSQNFRIVAIAQTAEGAEADYTQEECTAAAQVQ